MITAFVAGSYQNVELKNPYSQTVQSQNLMIFLNVSEQANKITVSRIEEFKSELASIQRNQNILIFIVTICIGIGIMKYSRLHAKELLFLIFCTVFMIYKFIQLELYATILINMMRLKPTKGHVIKINIICFISLSKNCSFSVI